MAWIEKRQRAHHIAWRVGYRDPNGKVRVRTFTRKTDAEAFAHKVEVQKREHDYISPDAGKVTLLEAYESMMRTAVLRESTRQKYRVLGRLYVAPSPLAHRQLRSITRKELREHLTALMPAKDGANGTATREAVARMLHRVFEVAIEDGELRVNPMHKLKVEAARRREPRFLTEAEVAAIAGQVEPRYRALVWTLAISGLRIGEASALKVRNVNLTDGTIRVVESSAEVGGRKIITSTKTDRDRTVDIPPALARMLTEHLNDYGNRFVKDSLVFTGPNGAAIRQNNWRKRSFQPAAEAAGIEPVPTVHDLRHTAASFMAKAGLTMLEAGAQLGHSSSTMTQRYSHVFKEHRQAKIAGLDALIAQT